VVGEINAACRACATCRSGLPNHCPSRTVLGILGRDGSHAEYLSLPVVNLHEVPAGVPDRRAVFVEPLAAAFEPLAQGLTVAPGEPAVVLGDGKLGLLQARALALAGAAVTVVGKHPRKLALAVRWGLGVATMDDPPAGGVGLVAECTGSPSGLAVALNLLRPRGTLVLKSTFSGSPALNLAPVVVNEITVLGSRCGPFGRAIAALAADEVAVEDLIDEEIALADGVGAYRRAAEPGVLKVLVRP
jgi:threonine dehydrogenase-like Zn-dependent dehydrogenase